MFIQISYYCFLIVFFLTVDGSNGYSSVGSPAVCKNMVTVGATETGHNLTATPLSNPSVMAFFSSVGPTYDGRIKPDVCAPGYYIFSAMSSNNSETGTAETCEVTNFAGKCGFSYALNFCFNLLLNL